MSSQNEITEPTPLLATNGELAARGWARTALMQYNPENIAKNLRWRLKEWEHYTIQGPDFALGLTMADIYFVTFIGLEVIDYRTQTIITGYDVQLGSKGNFPLTPYGLTRYQHKNTSLSIEFVDNTRVFKLRLPKASDGLPLSADIVLSQDPKMENMASTVPFSQPGRFFYENKIFAMPAEGEVRVGGTTRRFEPKTAHSILDWGRGIWPYGTDWTWGQAAGQAGDRRIGFNIGDGYGDNSQGTVNVQLIDGAIHKLNQVSWRYDLKDKTKPWRMTSDDGRFEATLNPLYVQDLKVNLGLLKFVVKKMHGHYSGKLTQDDGRVIEFSDLLGFAEVASQKW